MVYKFKNSARFEKLKTTRRGPDKNYVSGWGHYRSAPVMCKLIKDFGVKSFVEVGACGCQLSETILFEFPDVKVFSVDVTFTENRTRAGQRIQAPIAKMKKEFGDRFEAIELPSLEAVKKFKDRSLDMVYIDALHTYDAVKADIYAWSKKLHGGSILSGHDYNHGQNPGVKKAVDEIFKKVNLEDYFNWWKIH